jgi:hypothetical protein
MERRWPHLAPTKVPGLSNPSARPISFFHLINSAGKEGVAGAGEWSDADIAGVARLPRLQQFQMDAACLRPAYATIRVPIPLITIARC